MQDIRRKVKEEGSRPSPRAQAKAPLHAAHLELAEKHYLFALRSTARYEPALARKSSG